MSTIALLISRLFQILVVIVIVDVFLSYFLSPYHPVRLFLDKIVNPMLNPIRRVVRPLQGIDFSPFILILLLQVISMLIVSLLASIG
jgi:YggT family protein